MRPRHALLVGVLAVVAFAALACGHEDEAPTRSGVKISKYTDLGPPPVKSIGGVVAAQAGTKRMIARTAFILAEVADCDSADSQIQRLILSVGGYVTESSLDSPSAGPRTCSISGRVPAQTLDSVLAEMPRLVSRIKGVQTAGRDITDEYYDTAGRLENRRALRESYRDLMKRATKIDDLLEIQKALADIDDEIDKLEGRRQFLAGEAEMASITFRLEEPGAPPAPVKRYGFLSRLGHGVERGSDLFGDVLAGIIAILIAAVPGVIVIILIVMLFIRVIRFVRKRSRDRKRPERAP